MDERERLDPTYFSIPRSDWQQIQPEIVQDLTRLQQVISAALLELDRLGVGSADRTGQAESVLPPAELALQMHEVAGAILAHVAGDEQDLRQVITTLRTALAVSWDLYSVRESERVTVAEHMRQLRARIEDFERELLAIRDLKGPPGSNGSSSDSSPE